MPSKLPCQDQPLDHSRSWSRRLTLGALLAFLAPRIDNRQRREVRFAVVRHALTRQASSFPSLTVRVIYAWAMIWRGHTPFWSGMLIAAKSIIRQLQTCCVSRLNINSIWS